VELEVIRLKLIEADNGDWSTQFISWNAGSKFYKDIEVVFDDSYTHLALFNDVYMETKIPKENVVGFVTEPNYWPRIASYREFIQKNIGTMYNHYTENDLSEFQFGMSFLGPVKPPKDLSNPIKSKKMSILASNKSYFPGHRMRHEVIQRVLQSKLDVDIYGRGLERIYKDERIKGTLSYETKSQAYDDYSFTVSIENDFYPYWVSEKYWDPILCGCVPIYVGAKLIDSIFDKRSHIAVEPNADKIMDAIYKVHEHFEESVAEKSPIHSQDLLLNKLNMPEFIWQHFNRK
jgi:hypothetical protein